MSQSKNPKTCNHLNAELLELWQDSAQNNYRTFTVILRCPECKAQLDGTIGQRGEK